MTVALVSKILFWAREWSFTLHDVITVGDETERDGGGQNG
jgi:hypothetical protein